MTDVENFLKIHGIEYIMHYHPAVFTCEEADKYCGDIPGLHCKNLFLSDKDKKRFFLIIIPQDKKLNFSDFAHFAETKKVVFGSSKDLEEKLKLTPGSVSLFGILNDEKREVELYMDEDVYNAPIVSFHPNRNTATLELSHEMLIKFLKTIDRTVKIILLH
jgi:Ala-tRNA(Pro) deacylase